MSNFPITSASGQEMLTELPGYNEPIHEMRIIVQVQGGKFDQLQVDIEDQLNQLFVSTATWDLPEWEKELGIVPPAGQPIEQRRSVVRSKIRGVGKFSGQLLKNVAQAYDNGTIDVSFAPATGTFTIKFVSTRGIPPNLNDLKAAVEEIIPAHLIVDYVLTFTLYQELAGFTHDQLAAYTHDYIRNNHL